MREPPRRIHLGFWRVSEAAEGDPPKHPISPLSVAKGLQGEG